ncbi:RING finger protein 214 isoform X2 [Cynoglossus semilaevis]|uniref:RING finger protein 214 isoform X2 n=1 Tax=Cynoglossus semilaevis TaxID=244447 RepID=UPI000D62DA32|nr:RING finger protein 214 isoform X2 [Cynoglossus semilaevis]
MEANAEAERRLSAEEDELEFEFDNMTVKEPLQNVQTTQTESVTRDSAVNTDPDWEGQVAAMLESSITLSEQYELLKKEQKEAKLAEEKAKQQLQRKKEEVVRSNKSLSEKLESVQVKLQLNNSKHAKKKFLAKNQELTAEKNRAEEEKSRLANELEESERKLKALTEEQNEEQCRWQEELEELRREMQLARKKAEEAELEALQNEKAAVEKQRDVAMTHIEAWYKELSQYLDTLREEFPQGYPHEKQRWDKMEAVVRRNQHELQSRFQEVLQQLQNGRELETLPRINVPLLPQVPTADLRFSQVMQTFPPAPHPVQQPVPAHRYPHFHQDQYQFMHQPQYQQYYQHPSPEQYLVPQPLHQLPPHVRPPLSVTPPSSLSPSPSPPVQPVHPGGTSGSAPTGTLQKVLERLRARYPQYNEDQLTQLLRQVKNSRGTLAGMSVKEIIEEAGLILSRSTPGTSGRTTTPDPNQGNHGNLAAGGGGGGGGGVCKPCLVCQNPVSPDSLHPLSCSHTIHKKCIQVWLSFSLDNSCPFCPSK